MFKKSTQEIIKVNQKKVLKILHRLLVMMHILDVGGISLLESDLAGPEKENMGVDWFWNEIWVMKLIWDEYLDVEIGCEMRFGCIFHPWWTAHVEFGGGFEWVSSNRDKEDPNPEKPR